MLVYPQGWETYSAKTTTDAAGKVSRYVCRYQVLDVGGLGGLGGLAGLGLGLGLSQATPGPGVYCILKYVHLHT
jgi:hypothetical protein